jgi:hypothetical protein
MGPEPQPQAALFLFCMARHRYKHSGRTTLRCNCSCLLPLGASARAERQPPSPDTPPLGSNMSKEPRASPGSGLFLFQMSWNRWRAERGSTSVHAPRTPPDSPRTANKDRRARWRSKGKSEARNNCRHKMKKAPPWRARLPSDVASIEASSGREAGTVGGLGAARAGRAWAQLPQSALGSTARLLPIGAGSQYRRVKK